MKRLTRLLIIAIAFFASPVGSEPIYPEPGVQLAELTKHIPSRLPQALTGSQFVKAVQNMDSDQRERAILREILQGNLPTFLRRLVPVNLTKTKDGLTQTITIFVMPDYLAIGSDNNFILIPMNLKTATAVATKFGFLLPTRHIVDEIYAQSAYHFVPKPLPPGPRMRSTEYYRRHKEIVETQRHKDRVALGTLVSGHKKDVVITNLLAKRTGRIAIYGWHRQDGTPIQPLSTIHGACYADYSHGIRLVSELALQNGILRPVRDILQDPASAEILSDEGVIAIDIYPK